MRITSVQAKINFESGGGAVPDLDLRIRDLQHFGAHVQVVTMFSELNKFSQIPYSVIQRYTKSKKLHDIQLEVFKTLRALEKNTDVFHVEGQFAYAAALYRLLGGKPIVAYYNRELLTMNKGGGIKRILRTLLEKILYRLLVSHGIDYFIFTTPQLKALYKDFGLGVSPIRQTIMMDFFDVEEIRKKAPLRSENAGTVRIFASGRMIPEKGFDVLLHALSLLPKDVLDIVSVTLSGDGQLRDELVRIAERNGLTKRILFPGWVSREKFWGYLNDADIFIMPRWRPELSSVIVMEALSLGVPSIALGGGAVEWIGGGALLTFTDKDINSLAHALERLARSHEERDRLRTESARRVKEIDHLATRKKFFNIFESLVN